MPRRDIIVVGASSGGVEALQELVRSLPGDLPAAVFVLLHVGARSRSLLPQLLSAAGPLKAFHAEDGMAIEQSQIYVAPPDHHLLLEREHVRLGFGPKENHQRPCINVTFRSAALAYGSRVIGVVLTGQLDDGTAGLWEIKREGGVAVVQNPEEAPFPSMPMSALREIEVDYTVRMTEMGSLLAALAREDGPGTSLARRTEREPRVMSVTCPDCRGTIWEVPRGRFAEYRCRVGHTYSARSMLVEHFAAQEKVLWQSIVALEEGAELSTRLADQLEPQLRERLLIEARQDQEHAARLRALLEDRATFSLDHSEKHDRGQKDSPSAINEALS